MTPYGLKSGYRSRETIKYFEDTLADSTEWQADIYALAGVLGRDAHVGHIIDLGCGNGKKLKPISADFKVLGIDYGSNMDAFAQNKVGQFLVCDLHANPLPPSLFTDSVVICADVIEHLLSPDTLVTTLKNACESAAFVLVSTPDRERVHRGDHSGPPVNEFHVREWTNSELTNWLRSEGLPIRWNGWTVSNNRRRDQVWTSLLVMSKHYPIIGLPPVFEPAPIAWDSIGIKIHVP